MTKGQLVQEVIDRGYDYVKSTRIGTFIENADKYVCGRKKWPFLEETVTAKAASIELTSLAKVDFVIDKTTKTPLNGQTREWLAYYYPDLTETGIPQFFYLEGDTLKVFPVAEHELEVRYQKKAGALADGEEPLTPEEWQPLLVDLAVAECLKDDDEYSQASALRKETRETIDDEMVHALLNRNLANSRMLKRTGVGGDYL